jgi:hypothetical protein
MRKNQRKLLLSKETISSLENGDLIKVAGGDGNFSFLVSACNTHCSCPDTK